MVRWLKELFKPKLKCKRIGHKTIKRERRYLRTREYGEDAAAVRVWEERSQCRRCKRWFGQWVENDSDEINSLSMTTEQWHKLRLNGRIYER